MVTISYQTKNNVFYPVSISPDPNLGLDPAPKIQKILVQIPDIINNLAKYESLV